VCAVFNGGQKTCPKHVDLYSKNKFEKLENLFGFFKRIAPITIFLQIKEKH
jgi:hypothetical protein